MGKVGKYFQGVMKDRERRNRWGLAVAFVVFVIELIFVLQPPEQKLSLRVLMCTECNKQAIRHFSDLRVERCEECGGKMGYTLKCGVCDYEFPYIPRKIFDFDVICKN